MDNQTSGDNRDTIQDITQPLVETSPSASYPPMGIGARFDGWMPFHKRYLDLVTYSAVVEFLPPYLTVFIFEKIKFDTQHG